MTLHQSPARKSLKASGWRSPIPPLAESATFFDRCIPEPNSGCWLWEGPVSERGYGVLYLFQRKYRAHRVSWTVSNGEIPVGKDVLHKCDVPSCINPHHLFLGNHDENMADMVRKGRTTWGVRNKHAKLTAKQVSEIRQASGSLREIADHYGVGSSAICKIRNGMSWKHMPPARPKGTPQ